MEDRELDAVLEALLFAAGEPLAFNRLNEVLGEALAPPPDTDGPSPRVRLTQALQRLAQRFGDPAGGLMLVEIGGGHQLLTRPQHARWIRALDRARSASRLSRSALETLAIAAYKQPLTRADVEAIRGVDSANVLKTLMERRLVRILGRREGVGRPILYGTTREFLQYFGLKDLAELPPLKEFADVAASPAEHDPAAETVPEAETPQSEQPVAALGD